MHLSLDLDAAGGPVVSVSGEVDMLVADEVCEAGVLAIGRAAPDGRMVLDLREVTFLDSTGIGALVAISNAAHDKDVPLVLRSVPERIAKLLKITGLEQAFTTEP